MAIFLAMQASESATHLRIAFDKLRIEHFDNNKCVVLVVLTWPRGEVFFGASEGEDSATGQLGSTAEAAIRALERAADHRVEFELERVRQVSESNTVLAHLSILKPAGDHIRLLCGACLTNGKPLHAAVKAVLNATNRLFESDFIYMR